MNRDKPTLPQVRESLYVLTLSILEQFTKLFAFSFLWLDGWFFNILRISWDSSLLDIVCGTCRLSFNRI